MKNMKKLFCLVMALAMIAALGVSALAAAPTTGSITVSNPVNGVTYTLYKVFSATEQFAADDTTMTSIRYKADADQYAAMYDDDDCPFDFTPIDANDTDTDYYVTVSSATGAAIGEYLEKHITDEGYGIEQTGDAQKADSDTKSISWTGLEFGYYLVQNNLEEVAGDNVKVTGSAVSVDTTTPNATIKVKNDATPLTPQPDPDDPTTTSSVVKTDGDSANGSAYAIGDTVTYTISFYTSNTYTSSADDLATGSTYPIYQYVVCDNLPSFLSGVSISSVTVGDKTLTAGTDYTVVNKNGDTKSDFAVSKNIVIQWVDDDAYTVLNGGKVSTAQTSVCIPEQSYSFLYAAGSLVTITYTGTVTDAAIAGDNVNTATVTVDPFSTTVADEPSTPTKTDPDNPNTPPTNPDPNDPTEPNTPDVPDPTDPENPNSPDYPGTPSDSPWYKSDSQTIYTYSVAFVKEDGDDTTKKLAGAVFSVADYTLDKDYETITDSNGEDVRIYTVTNETDTSKTTTSVETGSSGVVIIRGVKGGKDAANKDIQVTLTETAAPAGYNKLAATETVSLTPVKNAGTTIYEKTTSTAEGTYSTKTANTTVYVDDTGMISLATGTNGIHVANYSGTELPSTGGIGTTIFYVVGGILVVGAGILLISKKRMSDKA